MGFISNIASRASDLVCHTYHDVQSKLPTYWEAAKQKVEQIPSALQQPGNQKRLYNGLVATAVLGSYLLSESASAPEYLFDVGVHTFHALIPNDASDLTLSLAALLDAGRLGAIYLTDVSRASTIPIPLNLVDLWNHGYNLAIIGYLVAKKRFTLHAKQE